MRHRDEEGTDRSAIGALLLFPLEPPAFQPGTLEGINAISSGRKSLNISPCEHQPSSISRVWSTVPSRQTEHTHMSVEDDHLAKPHLLSFQPTPSGTKSDSLEGTDAIFFRPIFPLDEGQRYQVQVVNVSQESFLCKYLADVCVRGGGKSAPHYKPVLASSNPALCSLFLALIRSSPTDGGSGVPRTYKDSCGSLSLSVRNRRPQGSLATYQGVSDRRMI